MVKEKEKKKYKEGILENYFHCLISIVYYSFCHNQGCTVTLLLSLCHLQRHSRYKGFTSDINSVN